MLCPFHQQVGIFKNPQPRTVDSYYQGSDALFPYEIPKYRMYLAGSKLLEII